ncbi:hypothetical protein H8711_04080 [Clostridiaceae bacterium NSJ-31]|uniref:Uncharacterized protein n=1 Tax=Ligaoa zhengdingensis TaxID=2763658 RepID=A0A926DYW0_9FIRM|nr:hypothetical protein [Ligaoa zhengdingensis]MBC8546112.1 hypothetical protein [Ligaoa zhengdingensis]
MQTLNVLGTPYTITVRKYKEDEAFERESIDGYCDRYLQQIVICDMTTCKGWEYESAEAARSAQRQILRHEIVHAFFDESGLADSSFKVDGPWAKNEELVDWIALQGPKIYAAWQEAGAL